MLLNCGAGVGKLKARWRGALADRTSSPWLSGGGSAGAQSAPQGAGQGGGVANAFVGSLGAILGSFISWQLAEHLGVLWLFAAAAMLLELAVCAAAGFARTQSAAHGHLLNLRRLGGASLAGLKAVAQSPYLRSIALFVPWSASSRPFC